MHWTNCRKQDHWTIVANLHVLYDRSTTVTLCKIESLTHNPGSCIVVSLDWTAIRHMMESKRECKRLYVQQETQLRSQNSHFIFLDFCILILAIEHLYIEMYIDTRIISLSTERGYVTVLNFNLFSCGCEREESSRT